MDKSNKNNTTADLNAEIRGLRTAIDEIDEKILDLINERLLLAERIGRFKKQGGTQVTDNRREKEIMRRLLKINNGLLRDDGLRKIFSAIIVEGRNIQQTS